MGALKKIRLHCDRWANGRKDMQFCHFFWFSDKDEDSNQNDKGCKPISDSDLKYGKMKER